MKSRSRFAAACTCCLHGCSSWSPSASLCHYWQPSLQVCLLFYFFFLLLLSSSSFLFFLLPLLLSPPSPSPINLKSFLSHLLLPPVLCDAQTDAVDQQILAEFFTSLDDPGALQWNTSASLCGQAGVICGSQGKVSMM